MKKLFCVVLTVLFLTMSVLPAYANNPIFMMSTIEVAKNDNISDKAILKKERITEEIKFTANDLSKLEQGDLRLEATETEPNDDPNNANYINSDTWYEGNIGSSTDEDWFYFYTGSSGKITVFLENIPSGCDYDLFLYKLEGSTLYPKASSYYSENHYENLSWVDAAGYYYVRIITYQGYSPNSNYRLYTHISTSYDNNEPDDNILTANTVSTGNSNYTLTMDNQYDHDWFKISITGSDWHKIAVDLVNMPNDYDVYLYDPTGALVTRSEESGTIAETIVLHVNSPGDYYVLVKPYSWTSPTSTYRIKISINAIYQGFWMANPLRTYNINGGYLYGEWDSANLNTAHKGVDSKGTTAGTSVYPVASGDVIQAKYSSGWGNNVVIKHTDPDGRTIYTRYAHLQSHIFGNDIIYGINPFVPVEPEDVIGYAGNSGTSAVHLHFTTEYDWQMENGKGVLNPEYFLSRSVSGYGGFEGVIKDYNGSIRRPLTYNDPNVARISGFTKDDPNFGARYTYGVMNDNAVFYDEEYFGMNYMTGKITPDTYTVNFTHPDLTGESESLAFSSNNVMISNHVLESASELLSMDTDSQLIYTNSLTSNSPKRFTCKQGLKIDLPTKGMPIDGDPAVYETYPIVYTADGEKVLKQFKVWYRPEALEHILAEPFLFTAAGKALFIHRSYPNELYQIDENGNTIKIDVPFTEIWDIKQNPITDEIAIYGSVSDSFGALGVYLLDLSMGTYREVASYKVEPDVIYDVVVANLVYDDEGTLYFDQSPTDKPAIYSFDGRDVSLVKNGAFSPKISPDGKLLAFLNCENRNPRFSKDPVTLEIINMNTKQSIGKLSVWGAIEWDTNSRITVKGLGLIKRIDVSASGLSIAKTF